MPARFDRFVYVVIQRTGEPDRIIEGLRISFQIQKYHDDVSNYGTITIYNLNQDTRLLLARRRVNTLSPPYTTISLYAGYVGDMGLIFRGTLVRGISSKRGADWVTELEGITLFEQSALAHTAERDTWTEVTAWDVLERFFGDEMALRDALSPGVGIVGVDSEIETKLRGVSYRNPAFAGSVSREVAKVLRDHNLTVDLDDVYVLISGANDPVNPNEESTSPTLSPESGLIGTPQITDVGVEIEHLLRHDIRVKHLFRVKSQTTFAEDVRKRPLQTFTCIELSFEGDNYADQWFTKAKGAWFPSILDIRPSEPEGPLELPQLRLQLGGP